MAKAIVASIAFAARPQILASPTPFSPHFQTFALHCPTLTPAEVFETTRVESHGIRLAIDSGFGFLLAHAAAVARILARLTRPAEDVPASPPTWTRFLPPTATDGPPSPAASTLVTSYMPTTPPQPAATSILKQTSPATWTATRPA